MTRDGKEIGYGEHPHIQKALDITNEDIRAGCRDYHEVYGKTELHYLTGDPSPIGKLDAWIRQGHTFDVWQEGEEVVFQLKGLVHKRTPKEVMDKVKETRRAVQWESRGFTYRTTSSRFPNGEPCFSTEIISKPADKEEHRGWMYYIIKTGRGNDFLSAQKAAFKAPEVEISDE